MKKFFANIKSKLASMKNKAVISAKTALASTSGEGYIDTGVKIIIRTPFFLRLCGDGNPSPQSILSPYNRTVPKSSA